MIFKLSAEFIIYSITDTVNGHKQYFLTETHKTEPTYSYINRDLKLFHNTHKLVSECYKYFFRSCSL